MQNSKLSQNVILRLHPKDLIRFFALLRMTARRGFTLVELLIAISIIGILATFLFANFIGIRQRARDGVRKSDLRSIQSALEFYRSDQGGYPPTSVFSASCGSSFQNSPSNTVTYMQKIPCDPLGGAYVYSPSNCTINNGNCPKYSIIACLENENDPQIDKDVSNNPMHGSCSTLWQYTLQNP